MSRRFSKIEAIAAALPLDNIDTDKILPGRYLKTVSRAGLGRALFAEMRYDDGGEERPEFVLNQGPWREAGVLVSGENFGCGSSREHAPWALVDFGISCVIAKSFADIFYNNCFKNGILPIRLDGPPYLDVLAAACEPAGAPFRVDLPAQTIELPSGEIVTFEIDAGQKGALLEGRDEIAETLTHLSRIAAWEAVRVESQGNTRKAL